MAEKKLDFIARQFSADQIRFSADGNLVEILNPFGNANISVEYIPDDEYTPFVVCFSFQHRHMRDEADIVEYVSDIIHGNVLAIEFFKDGKKRFGGDMEAEDRKEPSCEILAQYIKQYMRYYGMAEMKDAADALKVRGWGLADNFDAEIVVEDGGKLAIKKL